MADSVPGFRHQGKCRALKARKRAKKAKVSKTKKGLFKAI
jgi:hypothetical protein